MCALNLQQGALLCEPAVQVVRQGKDCQVWSVEKLANRLVDMRELYQHQTQLANSAQDGSIGDESLVCSVALSLPEALYLIKAKFTRNRKG